MAERALAMAPSYSPLTSTAPSEEQVEKKRGRLLSIKKNNLVVKNSSSSAPQASLIECAFVAGLCHDAIEGQHSTFSREKYPTQV